MSVCSFVRLAGCHASIHASINFPTIKYREQQQKRWNWCANWSKPGGEGRLLVSGEGLQFYNRRWELFWLLLLMVLLLTTASGRKHNQRHAHWQPAILPSLGHLCATNHGICISLAPHSRHSKKVQHFRFRLPFFYPLSALVVMQTERVKNDNINNNVQQCSITAQWESFWHTKHLENRINTVYKYRVIICDRVLYE